MPEDQSANATHSLELELQRARMYGAATLHEAAGQVGALPGHLRSITSHCSFAGLALTVMSPAGDNLWIHRALEVAQPGSVLVVDFDRDEEAGYLGEVLAHAAIARGVLACVIDGQVRDVAALETTGLPVFARGVSIRGSRKDASLRGGLRATLHLGGAVIRPGDVLVGDSDGVVCIPIERLDEVLERSAQRRRHECDIIEDLYLGKTTVDLYGLPVPVPQASVVGAVRNSVSSSDGARESASTG